MGRITWLKIFRERAGFKQTEFAETVGISKGRYVKLERMLAPLKVDEVVRIAKTLRVEPSRFAKLPKSRKEKVVERGN